MPPTRNAGLTPAHLAGLVAIGWDALTFRLLFHDPSGQLSLVAVLIGVVLFALGVAVFRGSQVAAWCLVGLAFLDAMLRIAAQTYGLLFPFIAFAVFLRAALYLRRRADAPAASGVAADG